ncbi:SdpA family antimicrobial peptide system protein [Bacillus mycoides]|uniref:SdpA family antimicrobial peptide system protein n=1 Tax=Bacillus mycoides TaxID=1405 RepID=UPI003D211440
MQPHISKKTLNYGVLIFITISLIWLVFFLYSIIAVLPGSTFSVSTKNKLLVSNTIPQGWGFYSKDPREEMINLVDPNTGKTAAKWPNNMPVNMFGLKREGRSQGIEVGLLMEGVKKEQWNSCSKNPTNCLKEIKEPIKINNPTKNATVCGEYGIILQKPVPWAWSKNKEIVMPSKITKVNSICSKK